MLRVDALHDTLPGPGRQPRPICVEGGERQNPLAGLHPFRLHRAYLAACRMPEPFLARLPSDLLETELQIKGESGEADVALARFVTRLSQAGRRS